jgi:hypothetical protein
MEKELLNNKLAPSLRGIYGKAKALLISNLQRSDPFRNEEGFCLPSPKG